MNISFTPNDCITLYEMLEEELDDTRLIILEYTK